MAGKERKDMDTEVKELKEQIKKEPVLTTVYFLIRLAVVVVLVQQALSKEYYNVLMCVFALVLLTIPSMIEHRFKIDIPNVLEVIVICMIFAHAILGEISSYYTKVKGWDTALHTLTGFLTAAVGFSIVDMMNRSSKKLHLPPFFVCLFSFCFSMMIGTMWEFFEFSADYFFLTDMQKDTVLNSIHTVALAPENMNRVVHIWNISDVSVNGEPLGLGGYLDIGLYDTMKDLAVTFLGSVTYSFFGFFYLKGKSKGFFVKKFIMKWKDDKDSKKEEKDSI